MTGKVFISHSSWDSDLCSPLLQAFDEWGIDYWFDAKQLSGGDVISESVTHAIRDCDIFVRICTPAAKIALDGEGAGPLSVPA